MPITSHRLNAVVHDGDGPPALLAHGALASRAYWLPNLEALQQVCRPVVVELWGHGRSPSPSEPAAYEPAGYAEQFELLRAEVGGEPWFTIGQSMGAALTLHYGLSHPEAVIAQVVTNSNSAFADPEVWLERNLTYIAKIAAEVEEGGVEVLRDSWINPGRSRRIGEPARSLLIEQFGEHTAAGIIGSFRFTNRVAPVGARIDDVGHPTLLTNGVGEEGFQDKLPTVRRIPGAEVVDIDANHAVNAQNPDDWNAAVVDFLKRHTPSR